MKFQKTLLAAALAVVGFGTQAAEANLKADVVKYANAEGKTLLQITDVIGTSQGVIQKGWYEQVEGKLIAVDASKAVGYTKVISGGQVAVVETPSTTGTTTESGSQGYKANVSQNNYWSYADNKGTTTTAIPGSFTLNGQLVNTTLHGKDGVAPEDTLGYTNTITEVKPVTTQNAILKDIHIGNLTEDTENQGTDTKGLTNKSLYTTKKYNSLK